MKPDMSDALAVIRQLRTEAATAEAFELALSTVATLVHNVLAQRVLRFVSLGA